MNQVNNTIVKIVHARKNAYLPLSPSVASNIL